MPKEIDLENLKNPAMKITLSCYVPNLERPGTGDAINDEFLIELTPATTNESIVKEFKKALLDMRQMAREHVPVAPPAAKSKIIMPETPALIGMETKGNG